jgi:hypothetical protein
VYSGVYATVHYRAEPVIGEPFFAVISVENGSGRRGGKAEWWASSGRDGPGTFAAGGADAAGSVPAGSVPAGSVPAGSVPAG